MALATDGKTITELKIPPQNVEAEMSILGSLMLDKDAIFKIVDNLTTLDFYKPVHQDIYGAVLDLFQRREPIDVLSVATRLKEKNKLEDTGGSSYLTTLVNTVPTASHVAHYAAIVRRKRLLRDLIEASHHISQLGYRESDDVEELIDEAEQKIFGISKDSLRHELFAVNEILEEAWERIDRLHKGDGALRGVSTGFPDLDNYLAGLQKSDLIVLAARPSLGKTSLALNIAKNVAVGEGKAVGIFSLEMSREQLIDRLLSTEANVDLWRLRTGKMRADGPDNDFIRVRDAMEVLSKAPIYMDDSPSPSAMEIRAKARRLQAGHNLGLVIVDYLQLMKGPDKVESRVQEVSEISRALKGMAKELNVPVLAVSQLSRGVEMRHPAIPKLSDLRESGCLAGDTLIMRADTGELVPIRQLVGKNNIPIFSLGKNWQLEVRNISKVFSSGQKRIFELKTRSGRIIKASTNHPFLTISGWQRVDELTAGRRLALAGLSWRDLSARIQTAYCGSSLFKSGLSRERMTRVATALNSQKLMFLAESHVYWDEVLSITPLGIEEVFDATVPDTHNFVANDFIVHNSIEQDADVVMFIYREDKDKRNTDRKNIAEILIEKHRNGPTGKIELYFNEETASFRSIAKHYEEPL